MSTKLIGLKEFRQNLSFFTKKVENKQMRIIVLKKKNKPVLKIDPINKQEFMLENLIRETQQAREQIKKGKINTIEEVRKKLGL